MIKDYCKIWPQYWAPKQLLTVLAGKLANSQHPVWKNWLIRQFMKRFQIDLAEAKIQDPTQFASFNDFFIRELKPEARLLKLRPNEIASPVDGSICQIGSITHQHLIQAKHFRFTLFELLGGDPLMASLFENGEFGCFYLAPNAYHRVHMPLAGRLQAMRYVPGKLFAVNPSAARTVPRLFARNERVICLFDTEVGPMAVILVGAMLVGSIHTTWHGDVNPSRQGEMINWQYSKDQAPVLKQGEEMGYFKMGSTVIVLFPKNSVSWSAEMRIESSLQYGQSIGVCYGS